MAEQRTGQPPVSSPALAGPTAGVRGGWVADLGLASLAM
jgi:hypothetical protein